MQPLFPLAEARCGIDMIGIAYVHSFASPGRCKLFGACGSYIKIVSADDGYGFKRQFNKRDRRKSACAGRIRICLGITRRN